MKYQFLDEFYRCNITPISLIHPLIRYFNKNLWKQLSIKRMKMTKSSFVLLGTLLTILSEASRGMSNILFES